MSDRFIAFGVGLLLVCWPTRGTFPTTTLRGLLVSLSLYALTQVPDADIPVTIETHVLFVDTFAEAVTVSQDTPILFSLAGYACSGNPRLRYTHKASRPKTK